jgi:type VI secretion system secreted protein Hcp
MAFDSFLKIAGIKGESLDSRHKDEIEVLSFSFGIAQKVSPVGGGGGAGKPTVEDFRFVHNVDAATPDLFDATCSGKHIPDAVFTVRRGGGNKESAEFYKMTFEDVLISSVAPGGNVNEGTPMEQVALNFASVKIEVRRQNARGMLGPWESSQCNLGGIKD